MFGGQRGRGRESFDLPKVSDTYSAGRMTCEDLLLDASCLMNGLEPCCASDAIPVVRCALRSENTVFAGLDVAGPKI